MHRPHAWARLVFVVSASLFAAACATTGGATGGPSAGAPGAVSLADPTGDDKGPGTYTYPTDPVYTAGSFDLTRFEVVPAGDAVEIRVSVASRIEDPWDSKTWGGNGFSLQMAFVHVDTDHVTGSGETRGLPGTNVRFKPEEAWDKVIILSPQGVTRLNAEIAEKAQSLAPRIIVPRSTRVSGKTIVAVVGLAELGGAPQPSWGWQVLLESNEGFPDKTDLLTRKVNEYEGQHRFGGGSDYDNDPHVIDILAAPAQGTPAEADAQYAALGAWKKGVNEPKAEDLAVVPMIYPASR